MTRQITRLAVRAFANGYPFKQKNTEVVIYDTKATLKLHGNAIAVRTVINGSTMITLAGWNTPTTRERLNGLLDEVATGLRLCQKDFVPFVYDWHTRTSKPIDARQWYSIKELRLLVS